MANFTFKKPDIPKVDFKSMPREDKRKFIILLVVIAVMIVIAIVLMPYFSQLLDGDTREEFVAQIRAAGPWGWIILLLLQILQVIIAFIPGEVVQLIAGVLYGAFGGWLICTIGTAISSTIVYKLVDRLGRPFVEDMISPNMAERLQFMNDNKRVDVITFILFFIPGLPKDVFTYFVPLTKMPLGRFLLVSLVARTPALVASTYGGSAWTQGNYTSMIIVFVIFGIIGLLGIIFRDRILDFFSKRKDDINTMVQRVTGKVAPRLNAGNKDPETYRAYEENVTSGEGPDSVATKARQTSPTTSYSTQYSQQTGSAGSASSRGGAAGGTSSRKRKPTPRKRTKGAGSDIRNGGGR